VRAQAHLKYVLNGMLAEVHACKEIVVPMANAKIRDGMLADDAILDFAMDQLSGFLARIS
jgi:chromate reductase